MERLERRRRAPLDTAELEQDYRGFLELERLCLYDQAMDVAVAIAERVSQDEGMRRDAETGAALDRAVEQIARAVRQPNAARACRHAARALSTLVKRVRATERGRLGMWMEIAGDAAAAVIAATVLVWLWTMWRGPMPGVRATATARLDEQSSALKAVDGRAGTEWLLPNSQPGSLALEFARPQSIREVLLLNSTNSPGPNRATDEFESVAYSDAQEVARARGRFGPFTPTPDWKMVSLRADRATRVVVTVQSWTGLSGGLAEVRVR